VRLRWRLRCLYEVPVALNLTKVCAVSDVVSKASGYTLDAWEPLVGVNARWRVVLGKKSRLDSIDLKARELGLAVATEQRATILVARQKERGIAKRGLVTDDEFGEIVRQASSQTSASKA